VEINLCALCLLGEGTGDNALSHQRIATACRDSAFHLRSPKGLAQFVLRVFENTLLFLWQILAGAIDVKVQHRHRWLIRLRFASLAVLGRAFQRESNLVWIF
jgi:hypothetical protein